MTRRLAHMSLIERLRTVVFGKTATHCAECRARVPDDEGFRVLPMQVYCSEEHAVMDQSNPAI